MRKNCGSAITQYAIILALIAMAVLVAYFTLGEIIVNQLQGLLNNQQDINNNMTANTNSGDIINGNITAGQLGGQPGKPVLSCIGDFCAMDTGDLAINGLPADFGKFVETSGTTGATDMLASLVEQIAQQLTQSGDATTAAEFSRLAELGHYLADHQEMIESFANECKTDADPGACLSLKAMSATTPPVPAILDPYFDGGFDVYNNLYNRIYDLPSYASYNLANGGTDLTTSRLSYAMLDAYKDLKTDSATNPNITPSMVAVTEQLFRQMDTMATNLYANLRNANGGTTPVPKFDLLTGVQTGEVQPTASMTMEDFLHPQTSLGTDLNSTLICATGGGSNCP